MNKFDLPDDPAVTRVNRAPSGWTAKLDRGHMLRRTGDGALLIVLSRAADRACLVRTDSGGYRAKRARTMTRTFAAVEAAFQPYRPCRWSFDCLDQATMTLPTHPGMEACDTHGVEFLAWFEGDRRGEIPEPECQCPDIAGIDYQPYCPSHGTPQQRGTDIDEPAKLLVLTGEWWNQ